MAYNRGGYNRGGGRGGNQGGQTVRLTRLFPTKKKALRVGRTRPQDVENTLNLCEDALNSGTGLVFFLWSGVDDNSGERTLTLSVGKDNSDDSGPRRGGRRPPTQQGRRPAPGMRRPAPADPEPEDDPGADPDGDVDTTDDEEETEPEF